MSFALHPKILNYFGRRPRLARVLDVIIRPLEILIKKPVFDCRMCGQCVLHSTGLVCPMTCPKELRNGPCGGVRADGSCEVFPDMVCIWVKAYQQSSRLPWPDELHELHPPVDWSLEGTSSWVNVLTGRDKVTSGCENSVKSALDVISD